VASVGHIAVGLAAARAYDPAGRSRWPSLLFWSALSLLPDIDVVGFLRGVPYSAPWGHRGATHSLTLAIAGGVLTGIAARTINRPVLRTAAFATVVLASHGLLDTMTDGGLGAALLWPFSLTRYFAPWRPIPVAPIGLAFFTPEGALIALSELALFLPLWLFALRRRLRPAVVVLWLIALWLIGSSDPFRDRLVGLVLGDDTQFARGYAEAAFRTVTIDEPEAAVRRRLGEPLAENLFYIPEDSPFQSAMEMSAAQLARGCLAVRVEGNTVRDAIERDICRGRGILPGVSRADVTRVLGPPSESCVEFTRGSGAGHFRIRMVCFLRGKVAIVFRRWS
jgi:inner membrane protein